MKKLLCIVLSFILVLGLTACGASPSGNAYAEEEFAKAEYPSAAPMEESMDSMEAGGLNSPSPLPDTRKLVKHTDMELQTKDFDKSLEEIFNYIEELGGYIEYQQVSGQSLYNEGRSSRHANINARIPVEKLGDAEEKFSEICNVTNRSSHIEDITDRYFDTDARLNSAKLKEARLLELLEKAQTMEDIIAIESKLSDIRYEIESLTSAVARMDKQVAYSYLNLNLHEVIEYDRIDKNFGEKLVDAFKVSGRNIARWAENSLFFVIEDLPVVILNVAVLIIVIYIVRFLYRKIKMTKNIKNPFKKKEN